MNFKDEFMSRIEAEHGEFVNEIKGHTTEWLLASMERCAAFQKAYEFLKKGDLPDEHYEVLLKFDQIIATVCNAYIDKPLEEDIRHYNAVKSITENGVIAYGCGKKVNELLRTMNEIIFKNAEVGIDVSAERKLFSVVSSVASDIKEDEAELLLQFKNPIEVLMQGNVYNMFSLYTVKEAAKRVGENDIYVWPYERNQEHITNDSKNKHNAIEEILQIVPKTDYKVTMKWLNLFRNIEKECGDIEKNNPYDDFIAALKTIKNEQGYEILQQLYDMGRETCILESELIEAAKYLADGGDIEKVPELANNGSFETFHEPNQDGVNMC